jgi:micrococcal nuclease
MYFRLSVTALILAFVFALSTCMAPAPTPTSQPTATAALTPTATPVPGEVQEARVLHVVDGDTIVVDLDGARHSVRYIGIDTPETHHPSEGADYWGYEATEANKALVREGSTVVLQRDVSETDQYGRLLRYVFVGDTLVNAELVRAGLARVLFYEPDVLYKHEIKAAETEAQTEKRGLYGPLPTPPAETPLLYKGAAWTTAPEGESAPLRYDPARGEPVMAFPSGAQVRVADAFWVPEVQEWWYWIGIKGFNGWTTGEYITREAPPDLAPGPEGRFEAYDWSTVATSATVYAVPDAGSEFVSVLDPGTPVQIVGLSWEASTGSWWYDVESTVAEGWIQPERLSK